MTKYALNYITERVNENSKVITKVAMAGNNGPMAEGVKLELLQLKRLEEGPRRSES